MEVYDYLVISLFFLWMAGMIGWILYLRDRRLNPPTYRPPRRSEEPDTWDILNEIDREGW